MTLEEGEQAMRTAAVQALRHLIGALLAIPAAQRPLVGSDAGPWGELLERVSRSLRTELAYIIRSLLVTVCERPEAFTTAQRAQAGETARRLLIFARESHPRDPWLVGHALEAVCRTFESDSRASVALLRQALDPAYLAQYGFEEVPRLTREVKRLIPGSVPQLP